MTDHEIHTTAEAMCEALGDRCLNNDNFAERLPHPAHSCSILGDIEGTQLCERLQAQLPQTKNMSEEHNLKPAPDLAQILPPPGSTLG